MIQILGNRVLILPPTKAERTTDSGIVVTDDKVLGDVAEGVVHAWGNGPEVPAMKSGDRILYAKAAVLPITIEGADYLLVDTQSIFCVLGL